MSRALFVSDIHISSPDDPKYRQFLLFLQHLQKIKPEHLFLVGDIFDLWIADRKYFIERYSAAIALIQGLVAAGTHVYYFEGNHDLDLRRFWEERVGAKVFESAAYFELCGYQVRVEHGDQMNPLDRGYLFLRWLLRTPAFRLLGRWLPNFLVRGIGERASNRSRQYSSSAENAHEELARAMIYRHAEKAYQEMPFDFFVSGHVHIAEAGRLAHGTARVFNLGTWLKKPMVLMITEAGGMLVPVGADAF